MGTSKAAKRYARALFDLAGEQGRADAVQDDLQAVGGLLADSPDLRRFIGNYLIAAARRTRALAGLFEGRVDPLTLRFLHFLDSKRRLGELPDAIAAYAALSDERRGVMEVRVTAAAPLADDQLAALRERLAARFHKQVVARLDVEPALLGGFRVRIADQVYDYSIQNQLETLHRQLAHA